jgi:hypothetical protein
MCANLKIYWVDPYLTSYLSRNLENCKNMKSINIKCIYDIVRVLSDFSSYNYSTEQSLLLTLIRAVNVAVKKTSMKWQENDFMRAATGCYP